MKITKIMGLGIGILIILVAWVIFYKEKTDLFFFLAGIAILIMSFPFVIGVMLENKREEQIGEMFLEFSRNLAESVATGTPVSKSIVNLRAKNYGVLTSYIHKLANQIDLGIPLDKALQNFAYEVGSKVISRAVALMREAEKAGGEIEYILESVAKSMAEIERLKKERKAAIYNLVVQGYIVFFIFIGIMLVMQYKILPLTTNFNELNLLEASSAQVGVGTMTGGLNKLSPEALSNQFLYLLLAQGVFAGLAIGKLAEGSVKSGIKHSFVLGIVAYLVFTGARVLVG